MLQNGFVVIFQLLNPEALKKPRNKRILYITFLFHNIKTNHTRIIVAVIRFILLFRFTNKNSMIENTTIIEHTIASQLYYMQLTHFSYYLLVLTTVKSSFHAAQMNVVLNPAYLRAFQIWH